ncbi:MAG: hypothetical protein AAB617_03290 [Patescibacteria group bacterium]
MDKTEINWRAAEYEHVRKSEAWYLFIIVASVTLIIFSLFQRNFFFAIFVVLASLMIIAFGRRKPQVFDFKINTEGVAIGKKITYHYDQLQGFSIRNRPGRLDELIIRRKTPFNPFVRIPLDSKIASKARELLKDKLPETVHEDSLLELLGEWLGF